MQDIQPIGVLDSGIGGLSVLSSLREQLPAESFLYVADSAFAPYGPQSADAVLARCRRIMAFFMERQVKAVVLACNTATAVAVSTLRREFSVPIIGMEPALKPAADRTQTGIVAVLATAGTLNSDRFLALKDRYARNVEAITVACHGWVESIENSEPAALRRPLLERYLQPVLAKGADTLILGCTHYPLIRQEIADTAKALSGLHPVILDTGHAVARELERRLIALGGQLLSGAEGSVAFYTSADTDRQSRLFSQVCGETVMVSSLPAQEEFVQG